MLDALLGWMTSFPFKSDIYIVVARRTCVLAIQFGHQRKIGSPGSREEVLPGDNGIF
jgi:hypothetical protein